MSSTRSRPSEPGTRQRYFRPRLSGLEERTLPAVQVLRSFTGLVRQDTVNGLPPDTAAAAGPNHVVQGVNTAIAIYSKATGQRLFLQDFGQFFNTTAAIQTDPVITYDQGVGRFYVAFLGVDDTGNVANLFVAVSNTSNPLQGFTEKLTLNVRQTNAANTQLWGDYPILGFNRDAVVVTLNMFTFPTAQGQFDHVQVVSLRKSTILDRNPNTVQRFSNNLPPTEFTLAPAVMHNAPANGPMYFAEATGGATSTTVRVVRMNNVLSNAATFTITPVTVNPYAVPPNAPQVGGTTLNTADTRMLNAEWRNGQLVFTHNAGVGGRSLARWYQVNTLPATPTLVQQGNIDPGAGIHTFIPSIAISTNGFIAMTYLQSSATSTMSMFATGRGPRNPLGTMPNLTPIRLGAQTYDPGAGFGQPPFRVGDYSATTIDPVNGTFWVSNEWATAATPNNWGTWIANIRVPGQSLRPPVPPRPPVILPGQFVRNYAEPNDTSDRASSLGTVVRGVNSMPGLAIGRNALGLPDYDWFKFRIQRNGLLRVVNTPTGGQPLEMQVWRRVGNQLLLIGRARPTAAGFASLVANVRVGEEIYVGVQGFQVGPGRATQGTYNMTYILS